MNRTLRKWLIAAAACTFLSLLCACAPARLLPASPNAAGTPERRPRLPAQRPPPATQNQVEFISTSTPSWFSYSDQAGNDAAVREERSEQDFRYLTNTGSQRIAVPMLRSAEQFPVRVSDVLGDTVLQFECEGNGCEGLRISIRSPDNRGTVVRLDTRLCLSDVADPEPDHVPPNPGAGC